MCLLPSKLRPDCPWRIVGPQVACRAELVLETPSFWLPDGVVRGEGAEAGLAIAHNLILPWILSGQAQFLSPSTSGIHLSVRVFSTNVPPDTSCVLTAVTLCVPCTLSAKADRLNVLIADTSICCQHRYLSLSGLLLY